MGFRAEDVFDPAINIPNPEPIRTVVRSSSPQSRRQSPVQPTEPPTAPTSSYPTFHFSPSPQHIHTDADMADIPTEQIPQFVSAQPSHSPQPKN